MLLVQTPQALLAHYQQAVHPLLTSKTLTLDTGFELALALYQQVKVVGVSEAEEEDDMLLFQYGTWDVGNKEQGPYFGLDLTRQVTLLSKEEEDPLLYQLRYEFQFDPAPFGGCQSHTSWSAGEDGLSLSEWVATPWTTPGFALARVLPFRAFNLLLDEV
jgi:hypothetical protein